MSPALLAGVSTPRAGHPDRSTAGAPGDSLVPFLPIEAGAPDPVALSMWYLALGSALGAEVRHDLFALWLFPSEGGVVLLGPEALALDRVDVPEPAPRLLQHQLYQLEEVLRHARYPSALAAPVRSAERDLGVMLLGSFERAAFGPAEALALNRLAGRLVPALTLLAEAMPSARPHAALEPAMTREALPDHLARAAGEAASGPDLVRRASGILYALLPHDRLEIVIAGSADGPFIPLSGRPPRRRWGAAGGVVEPFPAIAARFGAEPTLLEEDFTEGDAGGEWMLGNGGSAGQPARSILGARLDVGGAVVGFLLLGCVARDAYRPEDEETLALAARLLGPRVAGLRLATEVDGLRARLEVAEAGGPALASGLPLSLAAAALAGTARLSEALAGFSEALRRVLPHERVALHLRWADDLVIAVDPDAPRPFADLPAVRLAEFAGAPLLTGEREWLARSVAWGEEVMVPLRVAGRAIGTLGVSGPGFPSARLAAEAASQFAGVLAPHLELLRRGAAAMPPLPPSRYGAALPK